MWSSRSSTGDNGPHRDLSIGEMLPNVAKFGYGDGLFLAPRIDRACEGRISVESNGRANESFETLRNVRSSRPVEQLGAEKGDLNQTEKLPFSLLLQKAPSPNRPQQLL